ncbi:hypothetical protein SEVIR_5G086800v4 [Setaria viridis]|uniref:Uncharacterized protein n=1 Tax=Setaria viridis TaxID=4556 RepID=A0A4U6UBD5_SETVI|nr:uncharacterized protein LOC117857431 [Setaria viridis]TKW13231.1 hypothetical protein SEVIR_5G086800v2 [Setaria viridis]
MSTDVDFSSPYLEFGVIDASQMFKEMPLEATWDEGMQSDIHLHEGLLKQLAQGGNCFVGVERKLTDEPDTNYLHTQVVLPEHVEFVDSKGAAYEMFNEISSENVIWDEEVMPYQDTDNLLQLIVSGREHLDSEKAKSIIEFDDVGSIIWDEDMPHNLDMHINLLEQFADVKQGHGDNDFLTEVGDLPLFLQHDVVIANDIFDVLAVQELNLGIENLVNCEEMKGASVCSFEKCGIDTAHSLLGNLSSLGGFSQCSNVNRHVLEKMTAWRYGSFSPGQSELSVVDGEKLHNEIALKTNGNLHLKDHGAGFGMVLSSAGCMAEKGSARYVISEMPPWRQNTFNKGNYHMKTDYSVFDKISSWKQNGFSPWSRVNQTVLEAISERRHGGKVAGVCTSSMGSQGGCELNGRIWDPGIHKSA